MPYDQSYIIYIDTAMTSAKQNGSMISHGFRKNYSFRLEPDGSNPPLEPIARSKVNELFSDNGSAQ
jgi:hypothetical protein